MALRARRPRVLSPSILLWSLAALAQVLAPAPSSSALATGPAAPQDPEAVAAALESLEWRSIGPANMGGRVSAVAGIPGDSLTFWVGGADGGLWKTTNGGTTFEPQWQDAGSYSVGAIAVAPSDPNVVWLGAGEGDPRNSASYGDGVYRSTDGGRTWVHLGLSDTERIKRIVVHPRDPDVALVCALGHAWGPNEERGVFKTTDGGKSWRRVLYVDPDTGCSDIDIDLSNPRNVYAGMWTFRRRPWHFRDGGGATALYISRDGGDTWTNATGEGLPKGPMARIGVSVAQSSPNVVYLITETPEEGTLFRSDDYGETWRMVNDDRSINFRPFYYSDVFADPNDPETVYTLSGALFKSIDGGRTFRRIARGVHGDHQALWIDPADSDRLLSGSDGGFQVSTDGGETWDILNNVVLAQFYHVFVDDQDPYTVCGGLQDNGNWCGPSRTNNPAGILKDDWYTVSGGDGFYTVPVPGKPWLIYSNAQGGYLRITDTRTGHVRSIEPYPRMIGSQGQPMEMARYRFNWDAPIHISAHDPGTVYWGGNVVFRSTDYGHTWEVISPDLTTDDPQKQRTSGGVVYNDNTAAEFHCTILAITESPLEPGVIWVGTDDGNVQITRDGGATWTNVKDNVPGLPEAAWVSNIEASRHAPGRAYMVVDNHRMDDFGPHLWVTEDYGRTWRSLAAGLPQDDYVKVVREHPRNPDLLFAGMERGIYASWDRGRSWVDLRLNLPPVSVRGIRIHPRDNDLVIGTHGRGAWILDDIGPLEGLAEAMAEDLYLFPIRRATRWVLWGRDAALGQRSWRGENPPYGALINYWLEEVPGGGSEEGAGEGGDGGGGAGVEGTGVVTIRITDAAGRLVKEWKEKEVVAGVNRAVWDLRWEGPRPLRSREAEPRWRRFLRSSGPLAAPGTYTATVVVGEREVSGSFELRGDPGVETTQAEYDAQLEAALRARDLISRVHGMIDTVESVRRQLDQLGEVLDAAGGGDGSPSGGAPSGASSAVMDLIAAAREQLGALQEEHLERPPPRMGYRQYPRLLEQLGFVYRGILSAHARPTEGQLRVLSELEEEVAARAADLDRILDTSIAELNEALGGSPRILVGEPAE